MPRLTEILQKKARNNPDIRKVINDQFTFRHRLIVRPPVLKDRVAIRNAPAMQSMCVFSTNLILVLFDWCLVKSHQTK